MFKVGDKVRVWRNRGASKYNFSIGHEAVVKRINDEIIEIEPTVSHQFIGGSVTMYGFYACDLELIKDCPLPLPG